MRFLSEKIEFWSVVPGVVKMGLFEVFQRVYRTGQPEHLPTSFYHDDHLHAWDRLRTGPNDAQAAQVRAVGNEWRGFWIAAIRETFEECGVLLARERGLDTCGQEAWSYWHYTVTEFLGAPPNAFDGGPGWDILDYTREYLQTLKNFYSQTFKYAVNQINQLIQSRDLEKLKLLERAHTNKSLEEFVTNNKSFDYFTETKGDMIQKRDPIYMDPTSRFIKAHFYAPQKMLAGVFVPTIWVNILVIWFMTLCLYILLYFRVLKNLLDRLERRPGKKKSY